MSKPTIARDERPLGQLVWWLMFLGWTPILASYSYVLDPAATFQAGLIDTFTDKVTLFQQTAFGHPALGILSVAGLLQALAIVRLRWHALWPLPVFLGISCFIYVFNGQSGDSLSEPLVHIAFALFATWSAYLFLRHGHLLSWGFGGYVALLLIDAILHHGDLLRGGLLGLAFDFYNPSLVTTGIFVALTVLTRMVWLLVRDNHAFVKSLDRRILARATGRSLQLWWPMLAIFLALGAAWWAAAEHWAKPAALQLVEEQAAQLESELQKLIENEREVVANAQRDYQARMRAQLPDWVVWMRRLHRSQSADIHRQLKNNVTRRADQFAVLEAAYQAWQQAPASRDDPLEHALLRTSELQTLWLQAHTELAILDAADRTVALRAAPQQAREKLEQDILPRDALPTMQVPKCGFLAPLFNPGCPVKAALARSSNRAMNQLHTQIIGGLSGAIEGPANQAADAIDSATDTALNETDKDFQQISLHSTDSIRYGFQIWRNISLLAALYSLIVLLKTFLIVISRVIFSPRETTGISASFLPEGTPQDAAALARHGQLLCIPLGEPDAHFVSRWGVTLEGPPPARCRPLGLRFPFIRLFTRTWVMNRIHGKRRAEDHEFDAHIKVDEPAELVSWRLKKGEQAVFRFHDFVGMSEGLQVRRVVSLSITTLMLGRMIYYVAEGPGTLILRTTAAARVTSDEEPHRPAPMPKLVAWAANTHFGIHAELTVGDTFLSGYNLHTGPVDTVLWDTSTRRGNGPGSGIMRFAKSFLLPI